MKTIGWYVHHHGSGHRTRLLAALPQLDAPVVALSSLAAVDGAPCDWVELPLDLCRRPTDVTAGGTLHWAPLGHAGLRERMGRIAQWIRTARPVAMVVDVSAEVALLARLHGVPTVLIAQRGRRDDPPHQLAYAQAAAIAAPWTPETHTRGEGGIPGDAVHFLGAISRFDGLEFPPVAPGGDVLFLTGAGGHGVSPLDVRHAAEATPDRTWHVAGALRVVGTGVYDHGPDADVEALLRRCSVVVGCGGANVIAEVAAARRPFVCVPQARPFDEQHHQGQALRRAGIAEVCERWPRAEEWPGLLAAAEARDPARWDRLHDGRAAGRLAALVHESAR